jgi:hypothetical protein
VLPYGAAAGNSGPEGLQGVGVAQPPSPCGKPASMLRTPPAERAAFAVALRPNWISLVLLRPGGELARVAFQRDGIDLPRKVVVSVLLDDVPIVVDLHG